MNRTAGGHGHGRLADFTRDGRVLSLAVLALFVGALSAVIGRLLLYLIGLITQLAWYGRVGGELTSPAHHALGGWAVLVPVAGGLVVGIIARYGSEKVRGHGIPEALEAILIGKSRMEPRVAVLKPLASAVAIGTGGPFGAEGPIIMTGGAAGSVLAQAFHLSAAERKTLLAAGAAGGMSAIFGTPVAAVLLAVELLLFEWKPRSFVPVAVASATAAALRPALFGPGAMFTVPAHAALSGSGLAIAAVVGLGAGLAAVLLTVTLYAVEDLFRRLPVHWMWWPALGGLAVGIFGLVDPRVLGVGYDLIDGLLRGNLVGAAVAGLLVGKALVWTVALASGTSGGVLAPLLIIGGALGAAVAPWLPVGDPGLWAALAMAALMGAAMGAPLTALVFMAELTGDAHLLPGLLVACFAGALVTALLLRRSMLTEKLARRGHHLTREYVTDPLETTRVAQVMDPSPALLPATTTLGQLRARLAAADPALGGHQGWAVVDAAGSLVGVITRGDLHRFAANDEAPLGDVCSHPALVTHPDATTHEAVAHMLHADVGRLVVVDPADPERVVGYFGRSSVLMARRRWLEEERQRERRWSFGARSSTRGESAG